MIQKQILEIIKQHMRFIIAAHIHPEGDSIGSQLALAKLLRAMGKTVRIINADPVPKNLLFLPGVEEIEIAPDPSVEEIVFDAAIILDCPVRDRIGKVSQLIKSEYIINIDHHISNEHFGNTNWIDIKASSAGEMVYALFKASGIAPSDEAAVCMYTAIMTDTGSFRYSNTSITTHKIIADLMKYEVNPTKIYEAIYETKSFETLKLLAEVLMSLQRTADGKFVWFRVTDAMLRHNNLTAEHTDDFIDFVRMVEGAEVVAFLREVNGGSKVKVSLRSKSGVDVNQLAKKFGGGGHVAASGCVIEKPIDAAEALLLQEAEKALREK